MQHPEVAFRDCEDCQKWVYSEKTGERETKGGEYVPRYQGVKPPCGYSRGCVKEAPESNIALTEQNLQAWRYIRECRAVGRFPDDPIVRRNASLVEWAEQSVRDGRQRELIEWMTTLAQMVIR